MYLLSLRFFFSTFSSCLFSFLFFFNDTATTEIYTLSLHDALPISTLHKVVLSSQRAQDCSVRDNRSGARSEEHTSELQSRRDLVCRLLLEKKKKQKKKNITTTLNISRPHCTSTNSLLHVSALDSSC